MTQLHSNKGNTMVELVVTLAILGTLLGTAMPMYSRITEQTQADRNRTNMNVIRETFFHYFSARSAERKKLRVRI